MTANLTQMNYLPPEYMFNADAASEATIKAFGEQLVDVIDNPKRSDVRQYLYESMDVKTL